ncbi:indole-3-glycerol-phosphate synthase [Haloferax mediterranei ATCC 33500]|uniref:Indole-3-glycerol phosphate synthase n=1 Tax=Haloferax mediterranei (strain ATCC 33500 / DSM 1411 / JCM 8866 / NBRC 14739 / NCIMB 2177 / R-4) TaxID=523841 RepID=I3R2K9_HALMT|nr:indole-3-glycerol phosphate synthase [Haloferax mediterranei]AFK18469.2 indole-3-glycerol-phosphate synthase [Haloferax mediterranei ATCC 33500]EMA02257.1 indole-3-glycerol phosphate synthase [Haloferax mediterranei ATCC 33500]MDX5988560.1 indole-3-glycerol phosphate synthase [Haloferax mediterranei ATCC 33500]QCQ74973.1 indole-3-glycerol-phosphate synthase [Haloferax mediterranei ATCC 33500]
MNASGGGLAPEVRAILDAARERPGGDTRLSVDSRPFPDAVAATADAGRVPVIAEVKPTSPTTDGVRDDDPVELAREMVGGGATALSVLTEPEHFGGSTESLRRIREAVDVPVLRKDFILREEQLDAVESDLILLIARFVGEDLPDLVAAARNRGFQPLVEVHTREELTAALAAGADIIGVNNRDLGKLEVDLGTFEELAPEAPDDVLLVAESGVKTTDDVRRMREAGADALLVGTAIMDGDVRQNTENLTTQ